MIILVNGRLLSARYIEGIGQYTYQIVRHLAELRPQDQFVVCVDDEAHESFDFAANVSIRVVKPLARHPLLFLWWFEVAIPRLYRDCHADLFFSPDGFIPVASRTVRAMLVLHDLAYLHYPAHISLANLGYYRYMTPRFLRSAERIICVSDATRNDLITHFPDCKTKAYVIYNGIRASCPRHQLPDELAHRLTHPYFLSLGAIHPRKNIVAILRAFQIFRMGTQDRRLLVIAGRKGWQTKAVERSYRDHPFRDDIVFTGYLSGTQLETLMAGCSAFIYVSLFEGFGLPILEAMQCRVPVITSGRSAMQEVAADAALLVDPEQPHQIAQAMITLAEDSDLRDRLIERGLRRAKDFSWKKAASETWRVIQPLAFSASASCVQHNTAGDAHKEQ